MYVTGSAKASHVRTKTEIHFIAQDYTYVATLKKYLCTVCLPNVKGSAFLEVILPTL